MELERGRGREREVSGMCWLDEEEKKIVWRCRGRLEEIRKQEKESRRDSDVNEPQEGI